VHRVVESSIVMMKTFQVNVNPDVQPFMVDIKKIGVSENNDFDKGCHDLTAKNNRRATHLKMFY
jgi:hypothetical protein